MLGMLKIIIFQQLDIENIEIAAGLNLPNRKSLCDVYQS